MAPFNMKRPSVTKKTARLVEDDTEAYLTMIDGHVRDAEGSDPSSEAYPQKKQRHKDAFETWIKTVHPDSTPPQEVWK